MRNAAKHSDSPTALRKGYFRLIILSALIPFYPIPAVVAVNLPKTPALQDMAATVAGITGVILFFVFPLLLWRAEQIRVKLKLYRTADYCRKCGYDLCATPNRCPECGTRR